MNYVLTIDIGSTFTKVSAISLLEKKVLCFAKAFTTIETDVTIGLENATRELRALLGNISFDAKLASSSAAGGLKMVSCGLVPDLTAKASKLAANSAGAKVLKTFSYELSKREQQEIFDLKPDIVLLSGGIDGGNKEVIVHNAKMLAEIDAPFSVIVAGNKTVADDVSEILQKSGKRTLVCGNVMPEFNTLNIAPAKRMIRDLFIENIIEAKGLNKVQAMLSEKIIPTPLAVFEAAELLSRGTKTEEGLGELMAYDVGGATTDVYSMADGSPTKLNAMLKGFKEPFAKRSVEGDIGVRYSIASLVEEADPERIADTLGVSTDFIKQWVNTCKQSPDILPKKGTDEKRLDEELAAMAVEISAARHTGSYETVYTPFGEAIMQEGKDLTGVKYIIGSGGSVINSENPSSILGRALYHPMNGNLLKPSHAEILLDKKSIFAAMGLLGRIAPDTAIQIMKDDFIKL